MPEDLADATRRRLLRLGLALPATALAIVMAESAAGQPLAATPACDDGDAPTPRQTEGPFFTPDSPERRTLLEAGVVGTPLVVEGLVLSTRCAPVAGALLDFWQADGNGAYDNRGYRLRGHQFAGADGSFRLETVLPGNYGARTRHLHVKVQAPGRPVLTTQLYFPNEPQNARDPIFDPALVMQVADPGNGRLVRFAFVLDLG